ncbi:MAG: hypothetical protein WCR67_03760 [Bacilli bacterium]
MFNLFRKRIIGSGKRTIASASIFFIFFICLDILICLVCSFFWSIYIYSFGYDNNSYYFERTNIGQEYLDLPEEDWSYSINVNAEFTSDTVFYSLYSNENSFENNFGYMLSSRVFAKFDFKETAEEENLRKEHPYYCIVSETFNPDITAITKNGKEYEIVSRQKLSISAPIKSHFSQSGIDNIVLTVFIDDEVSSQMINSHTTYPSFLIVANHPELGLDESYKGSVLNEQYSEGFNTFLPLIYSAFLIPFIICMIAFCLIISAVQNASLKELSLFRVSGLKKIGFSDYHILREF